MVAGWLADISVFIRAIRGKNHPPQAAVFPNLAAVIPLLEQFGDLCTNYQKVVFTGSYFFITL